MGEKGPVGGGCSLRTGSHSWGLHNYPQMSGPQIHFCLDYMIDCPKGPKFPLNNCIMFWLRLSRRRLSHESQTNVVDCFRFSKSFSKSDLLFLDRSKSAMFSKPASNYIFWIGRTKTCECKLSQPSAFCPGGREGYSNLTGVWFANGFVLLVKSDAWKLWRFPCREIRQLALTTDFSGKRFPFSSLVYTSIKLGGKTTLSCWLWKISEKTIVSFQMVLGQKNGSVIYMAGGSPVGDVLQKKQVKNRRNPRVSKGIKMLVCLAERGSCQLGKELTGKRCQWICKICLGWTRTR